MRETDVSSTGTAITNRTAAAASARNHTSHSDKAMSHVTQGGEQEQGVMGLQSMVGMMTHVMVPEKTIISHRVMDNVMDATAAANAIATVVDATSTAASSSSSSSRVNSRVYRFIGSSSSDASPHPSDEPSTTVSLVIFIFLILSSFPSPSPYSPPPPPPPSWYHRNHPFTNISFSYEFSFPKVFHLDPDKYPSIIDYSVVPFIHYHLVISSPFTGGSCGGRFRRKTNVFT